MLGVFCVCDTTAINTAKMPLQRVRVCHSFPHSKMSMQFKMRTGCLGDASPRICNNSAENLLIFFLRNPTGKAVPFKKYLSNSMSKVYVEWNAKEEIQTWAPNWWNPVSAVKCKWIQSPTAAVQPWNIPVMCQNHSASGTWHILRPHSPYIWL